jgi:hypothetical protein
MTRGNAVCKTIQKLSTSKIEIFIVLTDPRNFDDKMVVNHSINPLMFKSKPTLLQHKNKSHANA